MTELLSLNDSIATLQYGALQVKVNAQHGARIVSFSLHRNEVLTQPSEHAENFGSTLWDAPQSRWRWPPPVTLDSALYSARIDGDMLELISAVDMASGLQFTKHIKPHDDTSVDIEYGIRNLGAAVITTAAWEITRSPGGLTFLPAPRLTPTAASDLPGLQFVNQHAWYSIDPAPLDIGRKAYLDVDAGWLAHVTPNRQLFIKSFSAIKPQQYSTGHAAVELYAHIAGAYVELENHGARTTLEPGEALSYAVRWFVRKIPETINLDIGSTALIDFAHEILSTRKT